MPTQEPSLEYILPLLSNPGLSNLLRSEVSSLQKVVSDILLEIESRKSLEDRLLSSLEKRAMHFQSEIMNLPISNYTLNSPERKIATEHNLKDIEIQKIQTQEKASQNIFELKKILWHYWLRLNQKQSQQYFLK
jgi:hypothetical protein